MSFQLHLAFTYRSYQIEAVNSIFNYLQNNSSGHPLIAAPTGVGKALIIAAFICEVMRRYPGQRILQLVHSKELVSQNHATLKRVWYNNPAGIYCAGLDCKDTVNAIVFASLGSARNNIPAFGWRDLIILDEAHTLSPDEATGYQKIIAGLMEINPNLRVIGLSATIFRLGQGLLTDNGFFTDVCFDITGLAAFNRLIAEGWLSPLIIPSQIKNKLDITGIAISKGDFNQGQLQKAVDKQEITEAAIKEALEHGYERNCWLVFASGIEHSEHVASTLQSYGISAAAVHSKISDDERDERILAFKTGKLKALVGFRVMCLDEETEILTSEGFVGIDDMTYDHKIAAWKMDNSVEFTNPKFIVKRERKLGERMINFKNKQGADIRVTANHRTVYKHYSKKYCLECSAEEAAEKSHLSIPAFGQAEPFELKAETPEHKLDRRRHINVTAFNMRKRGFSDEESRERSIAWVDNIRNKKYKNPNELTLDECFFIGFWLGDGTLSQGRCAIAQSLRYGDTVDMLDRLFQRMNLSYSRQEYKTKTPNIRWTFARGTGGHNQSVEQGYFEIEPYLNKLGSYLYWGLNKDQFESLLSGFFEADGNHHTKSKSKCSCIVTGTQYKLYELLQAIGSVRGFRITIGNPKLGRKVNHNTQWNLTWSKKDSWYFYKKLHNTIETEYKKERVWCVTSTTSYLICRRKGKVFVTGNTTGFDHPPIDLIIDLYPTVSPGMHVQKMGRGTRPYDGSDPNFPYVKRNCLVLDFSNNTRRNGPINDPCIPTRKGDKSGDAPIKICDVCGLYNHASSRYCGGKPYPTDEGCGAEFLFKTKLVRTAGTDVLIAGDEPTVESFEVTRVIYHKHNKIGSQPSLKVSYYCGLQKFSEYICLEHMGMAKTRARSWWQQRHASPPPETVDDALLYSSQLRCPKRISVITSNKFPEIVSTEW